MTSQRVGGPQREFFEQKAAKIAKEEGDSTSSCFFASFATFC